MAINIYHGLNVTVLLKKLKRYFIEIKIINILNQVLSSD